MFKIRDIVYDIRHYYVCSNCNKGFLKAEYEVDNSEQHDEIVKYVDKDGKHTIRLVKGYNFFDDIYVCENCWGKDINGIRANISGSD